MNSSRLVPVVFVASIVFVSGPPLSTNVAIADEHQTIESKVERKVGAAAADEYRDKVLPILQQYCFGCHAEGASEGDFSLDATEFPSVDAMLTDTQLWWSVLKNVRSDVMPPDGEDQPSDHEKTALQDWITGHVLSSNHQPSDPGPGTLRRLNRLEYGNTIHDLMGVGFDTAVEFPPDDSGDGFDNNADALSVSPLLAEKYVDAARAIVDIAVPKTSRVIPHQLIDADAFEFDIPVKSNRISFDTAANANATFEVANDASYRVIIPILVDGSFDFSSQRARIRLFLDGEVLHDQEFGWMHHFENEVSVLRQLSKGEHSIHFQLDPVAPDAAAKEADNGTFVRLRIPAARVEGPDDQSYWNKPEGYDRFFHLDSPPDDTDERREYAGEVLRRFCLRAFRRPVDEIYLRRLLNVAGFSENANVATANIPSDLLSFEQQIGRAMTAVLASPRFLFRIEQPRADSTEAYPEVDDFALASRLSFFLWSTMPDQQLFQLAKRRELRDRLSEQVERMLKDERSERLINNFVGQWLQTRDIESASIDALAALGMRQEYEQLSDYLASTESGRRSPPEDATPEHLAAYERYREIRGFRDGLDQDVRRDMGAETERLFSYVVRENRSLVELIDSDYAFLNQRLANHYGVPGIDGDQLQKVTLPPGSPLGGVLTQGTFLVVTSNPTRTSPVKRGLFILDNILGTPSPPAPAMVPELEESADHSKTVNPTVRELMKLHRSEALCSSCHARFDPLGLAFENFTAIGTWRETERGQAIQAAGRLISGESFEDVAELKKVLAGPRRRDFYRCLAERMLSYAIGRSLDFGDEVALERITQALENNQGRAQTLISEVVNTATFTRMRRHKTDQVPQ